MGKAKVLTPEELAAGMDPLYSALNGEPDLSCVLVGASFLDESLASLLTKAFIKSDLVPGVLDSNRGPLGSFSARTDMAYLMGLIPKGLYRNLRLVGEIRNLFAHAHFERVFDSPEVAEKCRALTMPRFSGNSDVPSLFRSDHPRTRFTLVVTMMANRLLLTALGTK